MTWVAVGVAGAGLVGGVYSANKAASAQNSAAKKQANAISQGLAGFAPYEKSGENANNELDLLMGQGNNSTAAELTQKYFPEIFGSGKLNPKSPYNAYFLSALNDKVNSELSRQKAARSDPRFGSLRKNFTGEDLQNEPGYKWRLSQGEQTLQRGQAAKGGLFSGAAGKELAKYGQGFASEEYQNAFSRDMANKQNLYNMLAGIKQSGQAAAGGQASQYNALGDVYGTMGANRAAGYIGQSNALNNAIGSGLDYYQKKQYIDKIPNTKIPNTQTP